MVLVSLIRTRAKLDPLMNDGFYQQLVLPQILLFHNFCHFIQRIFIDKRCEIGKKEISKCIWSTARDDFTCISTVFIFCDSYMSRNRTENTFLLLKNRDNFNIFLIL